MIQLKRTDSTNTDFIKLVGELDAYLTITDGDDHDFYHQFNGITHLSNIVVAYWKDQAIGCGAIKKFDVETTEVKRMYVHPDFRGQKMATAIIHELENWTRELGFKKCILETGIRQEAAVAFYKKLNYQIISNYGQYKGVEESLCFEKYLG